MEKRMSVTKRFISNNGTLIQIYRDDNGTDFIRLRPLIKALGYAAGLNFDNAILGAAFKTQNIPIVYKRIGLRATVQCIFLKNVIELLTRFIKLTLVSTPNRPHHALIQDNARMEAERLIELFNTEVFGKPSTVKKSSSEEELKEINATDNKEEIKVEPLQILKASDEPNDGQNNAVHILTVEDIEDIGNRASSLEKVYGFSLKQSLIAATKLKAEEINRDLSVILETCNGEQLFGRVD